MSNVFDTEIQARFRDINAGGHVDSVEAMRLVDEARLLFLNTAPLPHGGSGAIGRRPFGTADLVASHHANYGGEMAYEANRPFLIRCWVSHIGTSSFSVAAEVRLAPDAEPSVIAESTVVLLDRNAGSTWPMSDEVRADLEHFAGEPAALRTR